MLYLLPLPPGRLTFSRKDILVALSVTSARAQRFWGPASSSSSAPAAARVDVQALKAPILAVCASAVLSLSSTTQADMGCERQRGSLFLGQELLQCTTPGDLGCPSQSGGCYLPTESARWPASRSLANGGTIPWIADYSLPHCLASPSRSSRGRTTSTGWSFVSLSTAPPPALLVPAVRGRRRVCLHTRGVFCNHTTSTRGLVY